MGDMKQRNSVDLGRFRHALPEHFYRIILLPLTGLSDLFGFVFCSVTAVIKLSSHFSLWVASVPPPPTPPPAPASSSIFDKLFPWLLGLD